MVTTKKIPRGCRTIPEDWELKKLGDVGEIKMCKRIFNHETREAGAIPFYKIGTFGKEADAYISQDLYDGYRQKFSFPKKGDILISAAGTIGRTIVYDGKPAYFQDSNIVWIDNSERLVSNDYLRYILQTAKYNTEGGTIQRLYNSILSNAQFICPPKSEQISIAKTLSDADSLIKKIEKLIAKKRGIKQGAMQELLMGKRRLPGFSGKWEKKQLKTTATLKARIGWQGLTTAEYQKSGDFYLVTGTEFSNGYINWNDCFYVSESRFRQDKNIQLQKDDVLVTKDGTIGKVALIKNLPKPATLNSGVFVVRPLKDAFHPQFFYYLLCSSIFADFLAQLSAGSTINHLYQKDFISFSYSTPPTTKEQMAIAVILDDIDSEILALENKLQKHKMLKQGMMQALLTGRIRLV